MKTTIDIPEPLYRKAKVHAARQGITMRELVVHSLDQALSSRAVRAPEAQPAFEIDGAGFPILSGRSDVHVSNDLVNRIREEDGI